MTSTPRLGRPLLINPKDAPMTGTPRFVRFCKKMKKAEMWEKVAQLDADYNYRMADWVAHGGKDKLAEFQKAHARLKEAWAVFGDGE